MEREAVLPSATLIPSLPRAVTREERARNAYITRARAATLNQPTLGTRPIDLPGAGWTDIDGNRHFDNWEFIPFDSLPEAVGMPRQTVESAQPTTPERPHWLLPPRREAVRGGASAVSDNGLNFIANLERNLYTISHSNGYITSIPTTYADVGWGRDFRVNPLPVGRPVPTSVNAAEALELMRDDVEMIERAFIRDFGNGFFTQQQLDALVSLRFNTGALSNFDGLIDYLRTGNYDRDIMRNIFVNHYQNIVDEHPHNQRYFDGWMNRIERTLDLFFDGNYGNMPIDAITGRVNRN